MKDRYSLGLDFGTNSLGWAILSIDSDSNPNDIINLGSYIYTNGRDAKTHSSKAKARTIARGIRNNIDRRIGRRNRLMNLLIEYDLFSRNLEKRLKNKELNPYEIRAKAVHEKITSEELGRALYHICLRRGFKSNRKDSSNDEMKKLKEKVYSTSKILEETNMTLGELLNKRLKEGKPVRLIQDNELYYLRKFFIDEFNKIKEVQFKHHNLTKDQWDNLYNAIFWQRELKPQEIGLCEFMYAQRERRISKSSPFFQRFRILCDINNIVIHKHNTERRKLTKEEKNDLLKILIKQKEIKFTIINKKIGIDKDFEFNLHTEKRDKLKGDTTSVLMSKKEYFGNIWQTLTLEKQDAIIDVLINDQNTSEFIYNKAVNDWKLQIKNAENIANNISSESFEKGHGNICKKLIKKIIPYLENGKQYHEALKIEGYDHAKLPTGEILNELPYYGEVLPESVVPSKNGNTEEKQYGKIANPTVHIGLNRLRILINNIIKEYGYPEEIHISIARELGLGEKAIKKIINEQRKKEEQNEKIKEYLVSEGINNPSREDMQKYKLWLELPKGAIGEKLCPYTGKNIGIKELFSSEIEIDYILPISETLDNSFSNKTISYKQANIFKGKKSPDEAFNNSKSPWNYEDILERVKDFPNNKKWRFNIEAMYKFENDAGFLERQLNDTKYLSRIAKKYLSYICNPYRIYCVRGRITSKIREQLGLNYILNDNDDNIKNRNDYRHHAIDALVIALTNQGLLRKLSKAYSINKKIKDIEEPWQNFINDTKNAINNVIVFHRPNHGIEGVLHEDTNYAILNKPIEQYNVAIRKNIIDLNKKQINQIRDLKIRNEIKELTKNKASISLEEILSQYSIKNNINKIRILKSDNPIIKIQHGKFKEQKYLKGVVAGLNHHISFWKLQKDINFQKMKEHCESLNISLWISKEEDYCATCINYFVINKFKHALEKLKPYPSAKLIMTLHNEDIIKMQSGFKRIKKLAPSSNSIGIINIESCGIEDLKSLSFSKFKENEVRKVFVTPLGKVFDTNKWYEKDE